MWTPAAVRRLIALLAGVVFFVVGIVVLVKGISATGTVDIQSALVSGKIESASAGLIICFLGAIVIVFSSATSDGPALDVRAEQGQKTAAGRSGGILYASRSTLRAFLLALGCAALMGIGLWIGALFPDNQNVQMAAAAIAFVSALGTFGALLGTFILVFTDSEALDEADKSSSRRA